MRSATGMTLGVALLLTLGGAAPASSQTPTPVKPGMTEAEVRAAWGEPLTVRKIGNYSFMYYRNNCLRTCGTYDIVFLEQGQVVDAIVRDPSHQYEGISSSPPDRKPVYTQPTVVP